MRFFAAAVVPYCDSLLMHAMSFNVEGVGMRMGALARAQRASCMILPGTYLHFACPDILGDSSNNWQPQQCLVGT